MIAQIPGDARTRGVQKAGKKKGKSDCGLAIVSPYSRRAIDTSQEEKERKRGKGGPGGEERGKGEKGKKREGEGGPFKTRPKSEFWRQLLQGRGGGGGIKKREGEGDGGGKKKGKRKGDVLLVVSRRHSFASGKRVVKRRG